MPRKKKRTAADLLKEIGLSPVPPVAIRASMVIYKTDVRGRYVIILDRLSEMAGIDGWDDED